MNIAGFPFRPTGERELLTVAVDQLRERLPVDWQVEIRGNQPGRQAGDGLLVVTSPRRESIELAVEAKRSVVGRDVEALASMWRRADRTDGLLVSSYLAPPVRARLTEYGINYIDATGNIRLAADRPTVFIRDVGADRDPWRGPGRPRGNLRGRPAALVVRALADFVPPYSVARLVDLSGASTGATYRVVDYLIEEGLVQENDESRVIADVEWDRLLQEWTRDYGFSATNSVQGFLAPRGIEEALDRLAEIDVSRDPTLRYAVTGSVAAREWGSIAPARAMAVYGDDPAHLAAEVGLRSVETGANVLIARPSYDVLPYQRTTTFGAVTITGPSQTFVDLATGPGRNPSEAEELLAWMRRNPADWRIRP